MQDGGPRATTCAAAPPLPPSASSATHTQVDELVEESSEQLRAVAEEAKEELDKLGELTAARADLAFNRWAHVGGLGGGAPGVGCPACPSGAGAP